MCRITRTGSRPGLSDEPASDPRRRDHRQRAAMNEMNPSECPRSLNDLGHLSSAVGHHVINAFSAIVSNAEILRIRMAMPAPVDPTDLAELIITTAMDAATVARRLIDFTRPITNIGEERVELDRVV